MDIALVISLNCRDVKLPFIIRTNDNVKLTLENTITILKQLKLKINIQKDLLVYIL